MKFLYEKQARRFWGFLIIVCVLQACFFGTCGIFQAQGIRRALIERELAASSFLLEQGISPELAASAWNHTEVTKEGKALLEKIGHTEQNRNFLLLLAEQNCVPSVLLLLTGAAGSAIVLLSGAGLFLNRREQVYEAAERTVTQYADGRFEMHLPGGETGAIYQFFGRVEQLAMSLQAKSEAEHQAREFLKNMISDISHQLKTPLAALDMYMEILSEEPENEETVKKFSRKSMQSLERMEQLISSLLKMARLDTGNILFEKRQCFVSEAASQAVEELLERARQEEKAIILEGEPKERIFCDPEWTKEAIGNLVKNALDHTDAGADIRITWKRSPAVLRLTVEDNGHGIVPEDIHHIFKRFYRSRNSSDRQGAGLGLPLAKAIVEGQGGSMSVESTQGEGTTFWISFYTE